MLIIALGLAVIGLAALVFAVVTGNELIAWVCIGASVLGVVLLIIDALQERQRRDVGAAGKDSDAADGESSDVSASAYEYPEDDADEEHGAAAPAESERDADAAGETVSDDRNSR
ncbi:MAG: hypothetical protein JO259_17780 [Mycobacterium sp.]|nr:hypothetical protein [Mycobacterium sp.]